MIFRDRTDAGRELATRLKHYADRGDVLVLALPRGGVPVAYEVAKELNAQLDVFLVRKLGVPGQKELAMGAIASGGVRVDTDSSVMYGFVLISHRWFQIVQCLVDLLDCNPLKTIGKGFAYF